MMPCLSAARIILDGLQIDSRHREFPEDPPETPTPVARPGPSRRSLAPYALTAFLARRAARRALADALLRLGATSPHLLADIGLDDGRTAWGWDARGYPVGLGPSVRRTVLLAPRADEGLPIAAE